MAENKTKKSTKEVTVEKKFCTKCGRELNEGEVCNCQEKKEAVSINTEAVANYGKGFLNTILNMYKRPADTLEEEAEKKHTSANIIMLVGIAISFGLYFMGAFTSIVGSLGNIIGTTVSKYVDIPYFKIFIYMTLINFILSFIPIAISFVVAKIFGSKNLDFKKAVALYATSMAPTVFSNLLMAIMSYLNILSWLGTLIGAVVNVACFFHFILGYVKTIDVSKNRRSYALTSFSLVSVVIYLVIMVLFIGNFVTDIAGDFSVKDDYNIEDVFNW